MSEIMLPEAGVVRPSLHDIISVKRMTPDLEKEILRRELESAASGSLPMVYDHSMISAFQSCNRLGFLTHILHLVPFQKAWPLSFGSAIHKGLEVFYKRSFDHHKGLRAILDPMEKRAFLEEHVYGPAKLAYTEEACTDPSLPRLKKDEEKYKPHSIERGLDLLYAYFAVSPIDPVKGEMLWRVREPGDIEAGFAIFVGDFIFVGKIDLIVWLLLEQKDGIVDHKTTTKMTEHWGKQWNPHHQVTGYMVGGGEIRGSKIRKAIINCLYFNKNIEEVGLYFPTTRTDSDIEEWYGEVHRIFSHIKSSYEEWREIAKLPPSAGRVSDYEARKILSGALANAALSNEALAPFPRNTSHCMAYFRPCAMTKICMAGSHHQRVLQARGGYDVQQWLPFEELSKRGTGV